MVNLSKIIFLLLISFQLSCLAATTKLSPNQIEMFRSAIDAYQELDFKKALKAFEMLAKKNLDVAQYNLGLMYQNGEGTEHDLSKAYYWFEKSANQEFLDA